MLDDVAVYLVLSPIAAVVVLVLGVLAWGVRGVTVVTARGPQGSNTERLSD